MTDPMDPRPPTTDVLPAERLPEELSWAAGGHASDIALTTMADGQQDLVPPAVRQHVERCTVCTMHLGHVALLSIHVGSEVVASAKVIRARKPFPWLAVGGGLVVATVGSIPTIVDARVNVSTTLAHDVELLVRNTHALRQSLAPGSPLSLVLTYGTAALLLAIGLGVARSVSKTQKEVSR